MIVLNPQAMPIGHCTPCRPAIPASELGGYSALLPKPAWLARETN
jgi:hypothetical protein